MSFIIRPDLAGAIRWSKRGTCGQAGCKDPECGCSLCKLPIGVPEDDPRWDEHDEWCNDCVLCQDQVPLMLFRGKGRQTEQATFHKACFDRLLLIRR